MPSVIAIAKFASGRLASTANPLGQAKAYAYDKMSRVAEVKDPAGNITQYTYDTLNRLTNIVNPQGITVAFGYDAAGRRTSKKIFKVAPAIMAEAEYNYDAAGQLTEITNKAGNKVVAFNRYQYDANGNRTRIEDQDGIWDYKYDAANRLIVAIPWPVDYVKAEAFVYDKNGNRRYDKTAWDYHYDAANRLVENSTYTYTHDANGNLTARTNRFDNSQFTYAYTPEQQLSEVTTPEHKVQYKYDPLSRRTEKVVDGRTIKFIYDGQDIIAELDDANSAINTYTNGPGIDEPLIMTKPDGKAYYYHADALGSIKAIADDSGKTIETYKYKSYGQPTIRDAKGQPIPTSIIGNTRMFAAREYEQEIGLYNNRRRYLDSSRGAFTQEDPIGFGMPQSNLYFYALGNPLLISDPLGLWGIGYTIGATIEAGILKPGIAGTLSNYGGLFGGGNEGLSLGNVTSFGGFAGNKSYPQECPQKENLALGIYGGVGAGVFFSNAKKASDLIGISDLYSFNLGIGAGFSAQFGIDKNNTFIFSLTGGPGAGLSSSGYSNITWK